MDITTLPGHFSAEEPEDAAQLLRAHVELIPRIWPRIEHFFDDVPAWWEMRYDKEDVYERLASGVWQLWCANDEEEFLCIVLTSLSQYPKMKVATVLLTIGHDMSRWFHHIEAIELWARREGASYIYSSGRKGWQRVLGARGWVPESISLSKNLETMTMN
jgi:hypothetical protein